MSLLLKRVIYSRMDLRSAEKAQKVPPKYHEGIGFSPVGVSFF